MWNRLVHLWRALTDGLFGRSATPNNTYRRSNLHGRR